MQRKLTTGEGASQKLRFSAEMRIFCRCKNGLFGWPLAVWLGLCPQHRGSAGKIFKRRTRRGANRAARALRMAAQGCHHAKNALGAFYRRIQARCGGAKAVVATARKLAERVYRLLRYGQEYVRQSEEAYQQAYEARLMKSLAKKAASLGYKLVPETTTA